MFSGAFRERLLESWMEVRENFGRSMLQALGVMLGVASVLGGFSISDSQRRRSEQLYVKRGGLDKLNVIASSVVKDGAPTALQSANLGLRRVDAKEGSEIDTKAVEAVSIQRNARARVQSPFADQERGIRGIAADYLPVEGYSVAKGRGFTEEDLTNAAPIAVLGSSAAVDFFPSGDVVGKTIKIGEVPVTVVGVLKERVFRFRNQPGQQNIFHWANRIIAVPSTLVQRRMQGDVYQRVDRVTFRIPDLSAMSAFSKQLSNVLKSNHRQQEDFRLDDVAARVRRQQSQGDIYNLIFMLSGVLALLGGGLVNVNIQMASLKERVREVGVKMAIGASGREVFKGFMTEAMLLTLLGSVGGLFIGVAFSWIITHSIGVPLYMNPMSFIWATLLAGGFGVVFALFPAWKASRLSPMEALRYE